MMPPDRCYIQNVMTPLEKTAYYQMFIVSVKVVSPLAVIVMLLGTKLFPLY